MFDARAMIARAQADGITLALDAAGKLWVRGSEAAVARWLPYVREHKPGLRWQLRHGATDPVTVTPTTANAR